MDSQFNLLGLDLCFHALSHMFGLTVPYTETWPSPPSHTHTHTHTNTHTHTTHTLPALCYKKSLDQTNIRIPFETCNNSHLVNLKLINTKLSAYPPIHTHNPHTHPHTHLHHLSCFVMQQKPSMLPGRHPHAIKSLRQLSACPNLSLTHTHTLTLTHHSNYSGQRASVV